MKFIPKHKQKKAVFKPTVSLKDLLRSLEVIDNKKITVFSSGSNTVNK
jgi:hypothetical protein